MKRHPVESSVRLKVIESRLKCHPAESSTRLKPLGREFS